MRSPWSQTPAVIRVTEIVTKIVTSVSTIVVTATPEPSTATSKPTDTPVATSAPAPTAVPEPTTAPTSAEANAADPSKNPEAPAGNTGQVTHGGNMRETPAGAVIGQVCPGDAISFVQQQDGWVNIRIEQAGADCVPDRVKAGATGWVHQSLVTAPVAAVPMSTPAPPSPTPEEATVNSTQRIGPIYDPLQEERYTTDITLQQVRWSKGSALSEPKPGHLYVIAYVQLKNIGPGTMHSVGFGDFQVLDENGALIGDTHFSGATYDCRLASVDLIKGGSTEGCIAFEVPETGKLSLIYAPYRYEGLKPGRYLSFVLRPAS